MGKIITFYSYKGGTGRSMALANVGCTLSSWGYKVLIVDWDLEAPGIESFFTSFGMGDELFDKGLIDILESSSIREKTDIDHLTEIWKTVLVKVNIPNISGSLEIIGAGKNGDDYFERVRNFDISSFYNNNGGEIIETLRRSWKENFDFVLIDSRTGITDIGGICTIQLPDVLVLLFTATHQALNGTIDIAQKAYDAQKDLFSDRLRLITIPVPSRFDSREEFKISQEWLSLFADELSFLYKNWLPTSVKSSEALEAVRIPYSPYFSFGEKLPVVEQSRRDSGGLTYAYENISALLANDFFDVEQLIDDRDHLVRIESKKKEKRNKKANVFVSYSHKDQIYADMFMDHMQIISTSVEIDVWNDRKITAGHDWYNEIKKAISTSTVALLLISSDYLISNFIRSEEIPLLLEREAEGGLTILPVIIRPCPWKAIPWLEKFQAFPKNQKPLSGLEHYEIEESISNIVEAIYETVIGTGGPHNLANLEERDLTSQLRRNLTK